MWTNAILYLALGVVDHLRIHSIRIRLPLGLHPHSGPMAGAAHRMTVKEKGPPQLAR